MSLNSHIGNATYLEIFFQPLLQRVWYLIEFIKFTNALHCRMISCRTRIQSLDYCTHITKYTGIHESCKDMNENSLVNEKSIYKVKSEREI